LNGNILEVCKGSGPLVSNSLNTATKEQELTLLVDHVPIFTLPVFFRNVWQPDTKSGPPGSNKLIRVTIPGLEIKTQFYYDIQSRLIGQRASMILMGRSKDLDTAYALVNLKCYKLKVNLLWFNKYIIIRCLPETKCKLTFASGISKLREYRTLVRSKWFRSSDSDSAFG